MPVDPHPRTTGRRTLLRALGAAGIVGVAGGAGCLSNPNGTPTDTRYPSDGEPTGSQGEPPSPTDSATPGTPVSTNERLTLTVHPVDEAPTPFRAYDPRLADWLTRAAGGETVRANADVQFYVPEPIVPAFDAVELVDAGDADGTYTVEAEGGTRYHILAGAKAVDDVPSDAEVVQYADLAADRQELVRLAVEGSPDARFYPETALGEWARHAFFGGYVEYDGQVYRGHEVQQTDAAFFSTRVWTILRLTPTDSPASTPATISLAPTPEQVRTRVDQGYEQLERDSTEASLEVPDLSEAVESYAEETASLLSLTRAFSLDVEDVPAE